MAKLLDHNLALRVTSAIVLLPLVGALVFWNNSLGISALSFAIVLGALLEFAALTMPLAPKSQRTAAVALGGAVHIAVVARPESTLAVLMLSCLALGAVALAGAANAKLAISGLAASALGLVYIPLLLAALPLLHRDFPFGRLWVAVVLAVTFVSDSAAYFVGKPWGRRKLAPLVSPGKSVEGGVAGLIGAIGFMLLARATFFPSLTTFDVAVVGAAGGFVGPTGDLVESLLKRAAGVKDSGRLIPGHGGLLDRIDAVLFVGALVYCHVAWVR